jgi:hypothetical protein
MLLAGKRFGEGGCLIVLGRRDTVRGGEETAMGSQEGDNQQVGDGVVPEPSAGAEAVPVPEGERGAWARAIGWFADKPPGEGHPPWGGKARRIVAVVLLVLGLILVPLSVVAVWVRADIMSTDGYVATVTPLVDEPAIQQYLADTITQQIFDQLNLAQGLQGLLPDKLGFVAGPVVAQLENWARTETLRIVSSAAFRDIWIKANQATHATLTKLVQGKGLTELGPDGVVYLDLSAVTSELATRLQAAGIPFTGKLLSTLVPAKVPLEHGKTLYDARGYIKTLNSLSILLPILAFLFLVASVILAVRRQRFLMYVGAGIAVGMGLLAIGLSLVRNSYLGAADAAKIPHDASTAFWDVLMRNLRSSIVGMFFLGLVIVVIALLIRVLQGDTVTKLAGRATAAGWDVGSRASWVARYRTALSVAVAIVGSVVLIAWSNPTPLVVLIVAVIALVLIAAILFIAAESALVAKRALPAVAGPPAASPPTQEKVDTK